MFEGEKTETKKIYRKWTERERERESSHIQTHIQTHKHLQSKRGHVRPSYG